MRATQYTIRHQSVRVDQADDGHPDWCERGHHCAVEMPSGQHASAPEVWDTSAGRIVATRRLSPRTGRGHLEVRLVLALPDDEDRARWLIRHLVVALYLAAAKVLRRPRS